MRTVYRGFIYNTESLHLALILDRAIMKRRPKNGKGYTIRIQMDYEPVGFPRYRTLARVTSVGSKEIWTVMPGWRPRHPVAIKKDQLPPAWLKRISKDSRFFCTVNLGAEKATDLGPSGFEKLSTADQVKRICRRPIGGAR